MSKNLPIIAGCLFMVTSLSAQNVKTQKTMSGKKAAPAATASNFSIGVRGGAQFSSFSRFAPINTRIGWNAGLTMTYSAWEHWGVGGDITFTRTGGYYMVNRGGGNFTRHTVRTDYVRIVPKATYFFRKLDDRFRPKIFLGPNLGILTMAKDKNSRTDLYNEYHPVEIGITAGVGFNYRMARAVWLNFDLEYLVGLNRINKINIYSPNNLRTNSLSGSLGLAFGLNRLSGKTK